MTGAADFIVRTAGFDDLAVLADLEAEAFADASWGARGVRTALDGHGAEALIAQDAAGVSFGFAMWRSAADEAEILSIGVAPGFRQRGMATALLKRLIEDVTGAGAGALFLEVDGGNGAAIALYENAGFETVGARKAYYRHGADALIMRLDINSPR